MSNRQQKRIMLDRTEIQYVTEYIYLGQLVSFDHEMEKEIKRRVTQAWRFFWSMKYISPRQINQSQSQTNNTQHLRLPSFIIWLQNLPPKKNGEEITRYNKQE